MSEPTRTETARLLERALRQIRKARAEVAESRRPPSARCPIAIVGLACRAPGADDADAFWANLMAGVDAVGPIPSERWDVEAHYDPEGHDPAKMYVRTGGFMGDIAAFDPQFFGISPREALTIDPQQRLALEVAWHALEHAGLPPGQLHGTRTGVYLGVCTNEYARVVARGAARVDSFSGTSNALSVISGRVAYTLGLEGPAVSYDTACSSSLVAIHQAVRALQVGDVDAALAGGVNTILDPQTMVGMCRLNMLSPRGRCAAFAAEADGFARAEGCGVIVLERLADAVRAGRRVLAVIRGAAINQDGRSAGLTAPNKHAQIAAVRAALADGGLDPLEVGYVESHGTGTGLGDPIEMGALGEALCAGRGRERSLIVGAAKSNIGHAEAASGVLGLIKAVAAIGHGVVPPNLHFDAPNPHIPWSDLPVVVPTAPARWTPGLVGVNSFGFSGTNAHIVLGPPPPAPAPAALRPRAVEVLPLSARDPDALAALAGRSADRLAAAPEDWPHLAAAAARHREPMSHRATVRAADAAAAEVALRALAAGREGPGAARGTAAVGRAPRVGFVFTGQGAQHAGMGRALYAEEPAFAAAIDRCAAALADALPMPLTALLFEDDAPIDDTRFTQPAMFAVQVALAALWAGVGVTPHAVVGHSVGAYAAAVVAGAMALEDAARLVAERGRLMGGLPSGGAMAAVEAAERRVIAAARGAGFEIAAVNGPRETVISGEAAAVDDAIAAFEAEGIRARRLVVSHAFHSASMDPIVEPFRARAAACPMRRPTVRFVDDRTGALRPQAPTADDWSRHLREPVRFADAIGALVAEGCDALVEIGPRPVLLGLARATLGDRCPPALASMRPGRPAFADALAALWRAGAPIDWQGHFGGRGLRRVDLPGYPFRRDRYWAGDPDPRATAAAPAARDLLDLCWRPLPPATPRPLDGRWLVIGGAEGTGPALIDALRAAGLSAEGCPGDAPDAIARAIAEAPVDRRWHGIIDLAALDAPSLEGGDPADLPDRLAAARRLACDGALAALDALARGRGGPRLFLVTRRAVSVGGEPPDAAQALRRGLGRVMATEHRPLIGGLVDLDLGPPAAAAAALIEAIAAGPGEGAEPIEVALRGGARFTPRLAPHRPDPRPEPIALDAPGTVLITGGLGGLGLALAERLVARGARHLALMGRRPPSPAAEARIAAWAERGATVRAIAGDVARPEDVRRALAAIAEAGPPLIGVVHAAGVLDDGLLLDLDPARFDRVLAPKVQGALNLRAAAGELRFFALFSSIAGLLGTAGQGNYAAANAALDALAAAWSARGTPALSIAFGPWAEVGMAAGLGRSARRGGIEPLAPARGLDAFERALSHRGPAVVACALTPGAPPGPLFAELAPPADAPAAAPAGRLRDALAERPAEDRAPALLDALLGHIGAVLDLDPARIDPGRPVVDLGMDSLLVMEVLDRIDHDLGLTVYPREFYQQPSVRAMADYLLAELGRSGRVTHDRAALRTTYEAHSQFHGLEAECDPTLAPPAPIEGVGFVLSAPRSGSTLLRVMLEGHPALFAPPELWLLTANDMRQRAARFASTTLDQGYTLAVRGALRCTTEEAERRVAEMVADARPTWAAYATLSDLAGGRTLIDKTPHYATHEATLERIPRWFAAGPLIELVRHPLAVMDSFVRLRLDRIGFGGDIDPWIMAEGSWTVPVGQVRAFAERHPDRPVHTVRYEALVTHPRETLDALCDAIGLPFDPAMLDPYAGDRMTGGLRAGSSPLGDQRFHQHRGIDPSLADAWKTVELPRPLDPETLALADALGYALPARRDRVAVPAAKSSDMPFESSDIAPESSHESSPIPSVPSADGSAPRPLRIPLGRLSLAGLDWGPADAPAVLAVHGLLDHAGVWAPLAARLAARGLRLVAPDLRGHGASDHVGPEAGYPPLDFARDLVGALDALALRPAAVVGHSLGAATAAVHAAAVGGDWPLILVEPPLPAPAPPAADDLARRLGARAARHPVFADEAAAVDRLARGMPGVSAATLAPFAARALRHGPDGLTWRWDPRLRDRADLVGGLASDDWLALLGRLDPPPTLLFAEDSRLVRPEDRARQTAAVGAARCRTVPGGHHVPLTAPDAVAEAVLAALSR